jgi:hypothetical protein
MSALLFLVILPAVLAFAFGVFVIYNILPDVNDRLDRYYNPNVHHLSIGGTEP